MPDISDGQQKVLTGVVKRLVKALSRLAGALSTALILAAFAVTIYAVFQRYVMNVPLRWSDDVTGWMLVTLIMLGAAEAYRRNEHISIDLFSSHLNGGRARIQAIWADLAVLVFAAILGYSAWEAISFSLSFGAYTAGTVEVPLWVMQMPLVIGAALLGLVALCRLLEHLTKGHGE